MKIRKASRLAVLFAVLSIPGIFLGGAVPASAGPWSGEGRYSCPAPSDLSGVRSRKDLLGEHYSPAENLVAIDVFMIDRAQRTLEIAMYAFTDRAIADAVIRAASRGVRVWIYRDGIQIRDRGDQTRRILASRAGQSGLIRILVKRNSSRNIMHLKAYAVDSVWHRTGSANWSPPGEGAWCTRFRRPHRDQQDNNLFLTDDPRQVRKFEETFRRIWSRGTNWTFRETPVERKSR